MSRPLMARRRTIVLFVAAIAVPSMALLYLTWQSVERQREAIATLTASNRQLAAGRLASQVETTLRTLVAAALRDPEVARLIGAAQDAAPGARDEATRRAASLTSRHPFAVHWAVLEGGAVRYPALHAPLARLRDDSRTLAAGSAVPGRFDRLISEAARLEFQDEHSADAALRYAEAAALDVAANLRAMALSRAARCYARLARANEARAAWVTVAQHYGNERDGAQVPYRLAAALELSNQFAEQAGVREMAAAVYDELAAGRWTLSADETDYFLTGLERALHRARPVRPRTAFLERLEIGRLLGARRLAEPEPGAIAAVRLGDGRHAAFVYAQPASTATLVGFTVDLAWVESHVAVPAARALQEPLQVLLAPQGHTTGPAAADRVVERLAGLLSGYELVVTRPGGADTSSRAAWMFAGSTVLTLAVLALGVLLLLRDVARESETTRVRADLVSGVSHELKTPLTLIRVFAETLSGEPVPDDADRRRFCDVILRETDRLTRLIDRVLSFSRVDRGDQRYRFASQPVEPLVRRTLDAYRPLLEARGFSVEASIAPGLPAVSHDADAVGEALVNLLENAAKYSGDAREIRVILARRPDGVALTVRDHGVGIASEDHARIFERFYRAGAASGKGGYGLGLYLVKHVMDAHGGRVEVESAPGRGASFTLVFLLAPAPAAAAVVGAAGA